MNESIYFEEIKTSFGQFRLSASERGLTAIEFPGQFTPKKQHGKVSQKAKKTITRAKRFLHNYFSGNTKGYNEVEIDWRNLSDFQIRVLKTLQKVPAASVTTYSDLAKKSGCGLGARAVGNALGRNPLPVLIPCHRVLRKNGSLGGFSGGLDWKQKLLNLEKKK